MRIQFSILIVIMLFKQATMATTVLELRGFFDKKCYAHLVSVKKQAGRCNLTLDANTTRHISMGLDACPRDLKTDQAWYFAQFKINIFTDKPTVAEWIDGFEAKDIVLELLQIGEEQLANSVACDLNNSKPPR